MIAKFTTRLKDGTPTHFVPKILLGYLSAGLITTEEHATLLAQAKEQGSAEQVIPEDLRPKIHTMREFKGKERWHDGLEFQPATGPMYGPKFKFAPLVPVVSVQKVTIGYTPAVPTLIITVDGVVLNKWETRRLIFNDGFQTVPDFKEWFFPGGVDKYTSWHGRLIHYTRQQYGKNYPHTESQDLPGVIFGTHKYPAK